MWSHLSKKKRASSIHGDVDMADSQTTATASRTPSLVRGVMASQSMSNMTRWNGTKTPTQSSPGSPKSGDSILELYGLPTSSTFPARPASIALSIAPSCASSVQKSTEDLLMEAAINKAMVQEVQEQMECLQRAFDTNKKFQAVSQTSLRAQEEQIGQLREELEKCNEQIHAHKKHVAILKQTIHTQADELAAKEAEIQALKLSAPVDVPNVDNLVQQNGFLSEKIIRLKRENFAQDGKMSELKTTICSLNDQLSKTLTNRMNTEKQLKASEERFQTLLREKDAADEALEYEQKCNRNLRDLHNIDRMKTQIDHQAARIARDAHVLEDNDQKLQLAETRDTMHKQAIAGLKAELATVREEKEHLRQLFAGPTVRHGGTDMVSREQLERVQAERQTLEDQINQKNDHIALLEMSRGKDKSKGTVTKEQLDRAVHEERNRPESCIKKQQEQITRLENSKEKHTGKATKEQVESAVQAERHRLESKMHKQQQDYEAQLDKYKAKSQGKCTKEDLEKAVEAERHHVETRFKHAVTKEQMDQAVKAERAEHRRLELRILEKNKEIAKLEEYKAKYKELRSREAESAREQIDDMKKGDQPEHRRLELRILEQNKEIDRLKAKHKDLLSQKAKSPHSQSRSRRPLKDQHGSSRHHATHGSRHEPKHPNNNTITRKTLPDPSLPPASSCTPLTPTDLQTRLTTLESTLNTERAQACTHLALATQEFEVKYAAQEARIQKCHEHIREVEGRCRKAETELQAQQAKAQEQAQAQGKVKDKPDLIEQTEYLALKLELEQAKMELATCIVQLAKAVKDAGVYKTAFDEMEKELYEETAEADKRNERVKVLKGLLLSVGVEVEGSDDEF